VSSPREYDDYKDVLAEFRRDQGFVKLCKWDPLRTKMMALHAATVEILIEKAKFEPEVALGIAERAVCEDGNEARADGGEARALGLSGHVGKRGVESGRHHGVECVQGFVSPVDAARPGGSLSMSNRIVDVVHALNAGVASGEDFFITVMDEGGAPERSRPTIGRACRNFATVETGARLPRRPDIRFVDACDVFPMLGPVG
jgi:hypothetical protein